MKVKTDRGSKFISDTHKGTQFLHPTNKNKCLKIDPIKINSTLTYQAVDISTGNMLTFSSDHVISPLPLISQETHFKSLQVGDFFHYGDKNYLRVSLSLSGKSNSFCLETREPTNFSDNSIVEKASALVVEYK